jgi:hypothetical protein
VKSLQRIRALLFGIVVLLLANAIRSAYFGWPEDRALSGIFFMVLWVTSFPLVLVLLLARSFGSKPKRKDLD